MITYLFDGSFEGLLTCVYAGYYEKEPDRIIDTDKYEASLFDTETFIITDREKANKVAYAIISKLSEDFFHRIVNTFFSEDYDAGTKIFKLLKLAFKTGPEIIKNLVDPIVSDVMDLSNAVSRENHLMLGLVRFSKLKGDIYYCQFSPTYNQAPLLAEHFADRLSDQIWVMHDVRRNIAVFYDKSKWYVNAFEGNDNFEISDDELLYRELWKEFHKKVAISARENPTLQRSHMPKKYWQYLIEMH